ncbi:MAG: type II toxin-antitoxin system Phd/YefM family antitoxin [Acidobacteria bacterium]|nr:type II toxin-antitoxin system Phd/YefM family antitoxin [Acidobacteriota bacterium]
MASPTAPNTWQLQDAKARFSELCRRVSSDGPQRVTRQGKDAVVVISEAEFERLSAAGTKPSGTLVEFFQNSPWAGVELDLRRSNDLPRKVKL